MSFELCIYSIFVSTYFLSALYVINGEIKEYGKEYVVFLIKKTYKNVLTNVMILPIFVLYSLRYFPQIYSIQFDIITCLRDSVLNYVSIDLFFWSFHRLLHVPFLYKIFHRKHHEIIKPIGFTALYAHPVDFLLTNFPPILILLIMLKAHYFTFYLWAFFGTFNTVYISHSNTCEIKFHLIHHQTFIYNYGTNLIMDKLLKTKKS
mgnify:CR=1 FL=1|jgi:sterol desaturase/sphingolipid hydroxylase (fatty acid hydroxylase superfamily)